MADLLGWTAYVIDFHIRHRSTGKIDTGFIAQGAAFRRKYARAFRDRWHFVPTERPVFLSAFAGQDLREARVMEVAPRDRASGHVGRWLRRAWRDRRVGGQADRPASAFVLRRTEAGDEPNGTPAGTAGPDRVPAGTRARRVGPRRVSINAFAALMRRSVLASRFGRSSAVHRST